MTLPPQATPGDQHTGSPAGSASSAPIGDTARELANQAKREGAVKADALRSNTSQKVNAIAESARAAAGALKQEDVGQMSQYLERFAGGLQSLSGTIRDKSGEELLQEVNRLARENPTMFTAACVAIGFGLGRFAKATPPEQRASNNGSTASASGTGSSISTSAGTGSGIGSSSTTGSSMGGSSSIGSGASMAGSTSGSSSSISDSRTSSGLGGTAAAGSTPGVSEFSGSSAGPGASSVGEGAGTAGSRLAGGSGLAGSGPGADPLRPGSTPKPGTGSSNITNDEAGGLSS